MEFKLNIGDPKSAKTYKKILKDDECQPLLGKKIGQTLTGDSIGLAGYELKVTGGSDFCGFPMRRDVEGTMRKKVLLVSGVGIRNDTPGKKTRKNVAGNTIYAKTAQVNLMVMKQGKEPIETAAPKEGAEGEAPTEEKEEKEKKPKKEKKAKKE